MELITQKEWLDRVNELTAQRNFYRRDAARLRRDADDVLSERDALRARVSELEGLLLRWRSHYRTGESILDDSEAALSGEAPEPDAGEPAMPKHTCMDNIPGTAEARGPECCDACAGEPADEDCADCTCDATGQCKWHQSQEECHPECSCEECGGSGKSFAHCENGEPGPDCPAGCVRGEDGIYREPAEPCERCGGSPGTECDECIGGEE